MPAKNDIETIAEITQESPDVRIQILTSFSDEDMVFPAIQAGALGYLR